MNALKIMAIISLALIITGFCLPWLDFYVPQSGIDAVHTGIIFISGSHRFSILSMMVLFVLIPVLSALATWRIIFAHKYGAALIYIALVNMIMLFAVWIVLGFTLLRGIYPGFYIMLAGIVLLNCLTISGYVRRRKL